MPNPPPPNPAPPSHVINDPYADWFTNNEADNPPPLPGPLPKGDRALMRLYVPSENTELDMGHGNTTPGIRMATDNHVHMTARNPLTTISLGSPGGDGIGSRLSGDQAMGLQIYTKGEKRERIEGSTIELYENTKTEEVQENLVQNYKCPKRETVYGPVHEDFRNTHNWDVFRDAKHTFRSNVDVVVEGHRSENIGGNTSHYKKGHFYSVTVGTVNDACLGEKSSTVAGLNVSVNIVGTISVTGGLQTAVVGGGKVEYIKGPTLTVTSPVKISVDKFSMEKKTLKVENTSFTRRINAGVELSDEDLAISKSKSRIFSAAMTIIK